MTRTDRRRFPALLAFIAALALLALSGAAQAQTDTVVLVSNTGQAVTRGGSPSARIAGATTLITMSVDSSLRGVPPINASALGITLRLPPGRAASSMSSSRGCDLPYAHDTAARLR